MKAEEFNKELYGDNFIDKEACEFAEAYAEQQIKELKELLKNIGLCLEDHTESIKQALK